MQSPERAHPATRPALLSFTVVLSLLLGFALADGRSATAFGHAVVPNALTCPGTATLEELVTCIVAQMPGRDSDGFVVPDQNVQNDWSGVVGQMLNERCDDIPLPASLVNVYSLGSFMDQGNAQSYCVLMEVAEGSTPGFVGRGWGTFITRARPSREVDVQIAHPIADADTEWEGIGVFKGTDSRSFLMAGTHRAASTQLSACQQASTPITVSDVAHNVQNLFQPATQTLLSFYGPRSFAVLQFHGHAPSASCPDPPDGPNVYLTHGLNRQPVPGDKILDLQANLLKYNPTWSVAVPDPTNPPCGLHGSTNVQGRLLNGVQGDVCSIEATTYSGRFLHIEQKPSGPDAASAYRDASNWIAAINDTWPAAAPAGAGSRPGGSLAGR